MTGRRRRRRCAVLLGVVALVGGVLGEGAGREAAALEGVEDVIQALVGGFGVFGAPDEAGADEPFGAVLFHEGNDGGIGFAFGGGGHIKTQADVESNELAWDARPTGLRGRGEDE